MQDHTTDTTARTERLKTIARITMLCFERDGFHRSLWRHKMTTPSGQGSSFDNWADLTEGGVVNWGHGQMLPIP